MAMAISASDVARMRENLLFDGPTKGRKLSRFWTLLVLAAIIASAGVVSDSTATVIGAMIVAPLMTPIIGTVLSIVTGDRINLLRSVSMVLGGALVAIGIGYLLGLVAPIDVVADTNAQVAARVQPRLLDLLAALATGVVGAFAQCREDVSDTLPGVAIAISLVPPLTVVGLTMEAGAYDESAGALLLFLTNVAAILVTGCIVMALFGVFGQALAAGPAHLNRRNAVAGVIVVAVIILVPLVVSSAKLTEARIEEHDIASVTDAWADSAGWSVVGVDRADGEATVTVVGPLPAPDADVLRSMLDARGLADLDVRVRLVPQEEVLLPGS
jgi:uncharacterized hydrophobic protein (TIGR00271 family)